MTVSLGQHGSRRTGGCSLRNVSLLTLTWLCCSETSDVTFLFRPQQRSREGILGFPKPGSLEVAPESQQRRNKGRVRAIAIVGCNFMRNPHRIDHFFTSNQEGPVFALFTMCSQSSLSFPAHSSCSVICCCMDGSVSVGLI